MKRIKPKQLKFNVDKCWTDGENFIGRFIARCTAARILNGEAEAYQFGGYECGKDSPYHTICAPKEELAHWILRTVGYHVAPYHLYKLTEVDAEKEGGE